MNLFEKIFINILEIKIKRSAVAMDLLNKLNGYKTYMTGTAAILTAVVSYLNNAINLTELISAIFLSIQTMNIRHSITTTVSDASGKKL